MTGLPLPDTFVTNTALSVVSWQPLETCSYDDSLAVFRFQVAGVVESGDQYNELQSHEISQAQRYHREEDRIRFIYTRRILRILLGRYLNQKPDEVYFTAGVNKKPEIKDNSEWHINVSHSGDWIVIAIGKSSVGIDTERINPDFPFQDMLMTSFSQDEQQYIETSLDGRFAFYDLWTRKEALVKATAKGLDDDFSQVPSLVGTHASRSSLIGAVGYWTVASFVLSEAYPAAVAYKPMDEMPKFYTLDSGLFSRSES